jgi:hypothetical protein
MRPREAEDAIVMAMRPLLMEHDFRRRKTAWFRHDRQFLQLIEVQIGQHAIIVKLGVVYRPLNRATHPASHDCHISIGLGSVVHPGLDWRSLRAYRDWIWPGDDRIRESANVIREVAIPVLDQWQSEESIRQFLKTSLGSRSKVRQEFAMHLAQQGPGR